jgi:hypothetical protein
MEGDAVGGREFRVLDAHEVAGHVGALQQAGGMGQPVHLHADRADGHPDAQQEDQGHGSRNGSPEAHRGGI